MGRTTPIGGGGHGDGEKCGERERGGGEKACKQDRGEGCFHCGNMWLGFRWDSQGNPIESPPIRSGSGSTSDPRESIQTMGEHGLEKSKCSFRKIENLVEGKFVQRNRRGMGCPAKARWREGNGKIPRFRFPVFAIFVGTKIGKPWQA
jgi:hypothetical protein